VMNLFMVPVMKQVCDGWTCSMCICSLFEWKWRGIGVLLLVNYRHANTPTWDFCQITGRLRLVRFNENLLTGNVPLVIIRCGDLHDAPPAIVSPPARLNCCLHSTKQADSWSVGRSVSLKLHFISQKYDSIVSVQNLRRSVCHKRIICHPSLLLTAY
jgi:hypothetical protein